MQRLFSTFPNSWPGLGLLIMRCSLALSLPLAPIWQDEALHWMVPIRVASILLSGLLIAGAWTPLCALAAALYQLAQFSVDKGAVPIPLLFGGFSIALALLGPGAWSLDAMVYGRKRVDVSG